MIENKEIANLRVVAFIVVERCTGPAYACRAEVGRNIERPFS